MKYGVSVDWLRGLSAAMVLLLPVVAAAESYGDRPEIKTFIDDMVVRHQFDRQQLQQQFDQVQKKQRIIDAMSRPAEKTKNWGEYQDIFIKPQRIRKGVKFWQENSEALAAAEKQFGVPAEMIVAIIGVETNYGGNKGSWRVMDALATLAFDYPDQDNKKYVERRKTFFTKELEHFLLLAREQQRDPLTLKGSYAGAMGYGQFMPSSYRRYATDFDGDGFTDIWENKRDAIGSVANYFLEHGWRAGEPVTSRNRVAKGYDKSVLNLSRSKRKAAGLTVADLAEKGYTPVQQVESTLLAGAIKLQGKKGAEFWMGFNNFYVITRYNTSIKYAMAVHQLSQQIAAAKAAAEV
ncbi:lytic murein transglycosylase B [Candidatus Pelagadaptatus aseana]|uniref:lytic murein transglycosylase B n=1 Tax=Candidatus Pelagadaptatus aseana TaxID=3120508 RepID=UPI003C6EE164